MAAPDLALVQSLLDQLRQDQAEDRAQQDALNAKGHEVAKLERELQQLVRSFEPVSREQVLQARGARDEAWQGLRETPQELTARAGTFERHVATADTLADLRHERAEHDAERQVKAAALDQQRAEEQALRLRHEAIQSRIHRRGAEWDALTTACGQPELPLELALSSLQRADPRVLQPPGGGFRAGHAQAPGRASRWPAGRHLGHERRLKGSTLPGPAPGGPGTAG
jgi:hypothetical protein